jgi:hypothetical protein
MAGERTVDIEFCRVTGHPSRLRRMFFDLLPFWQGQNPQFWLTIEALTDIEHDTKFLYSIQYPSGEKDPPQQLSTLPIKKNEKRVYKLAPLPLIYTGDAFLIVAEILNASKVSEFQTVYSFNTTNRSWFTLAIVTGILAGAFASIGNWLIQILN